MRHAKRNQRLSRPSAHREAIVHNLVKGLLAHGRIRTTYARAKEAQRLADRLVSFGKDGSIHARRRAFRILQDRTLVRRLFADVAPAYIDAPGGYTRVMRLAFRRGDGAQQALLEFTRLPAEAPTTPPKGKAKPPTAPAVPESGRAPSPTGEGKPPKPKKFLEGLRDLFRRKKGAPGDGHAHR